MMVTTGPLTITELLGEDDDGKAIEPRTSHAKGVFVDVTQTENVSTTGAIPAGSVFAYIEPDGFGDSWSVKPGDEISDGTRSIKVSTVVPANNPRTSELHHIEASGGLV